MEVNCRRVLDNRETRFSTVPQLSSAKLFHMRLPRAKPQTLPDLRQSDYIQRRRATTMERKAMLDGTAMVGQFAGKNVSLQYVHYLVLGPSAEDLLAWSVELLIRRLSA
nr:hypothetical protein CFP56_09701 [Quercus suber]